jgi:hypothetical protein
MGQKQDLVNALVENESLLEVSDSALQEMGQSRKNLENYSSQLREQLRDLDQLMYVQGVAQP